jgi:hypothetical protein
MFPPASVVTIRECLEFCIKFGYYYARKSAGGKGRAARPQRLSCRVAIKPVAQAFQPVQAQAKHCGEKLIHDKIKNWE